MAHQSAPKPLGPKNRPRHRAKRVELAGAGADVRHGAEVEIEVADIGAVRIDIRLLAITMSLIKRAALVFSAGNHGTFVHVRSCCSRLRSDMKSQTAKT